MYIWYLYVCMYVCMYVYVCHVREYVSMYVYTYDKNIANDTYLGITSPQISHHQRPSVITATRH